MTLHPDRQHALRGMFLIASAAIVWSSGGPIVRYIDSVDAWTTIFWRSFTACLFLLSFMALRRRRIITQFVGIGLPGFLVGVSFSCSSISLVIALRLTTIANTLMIMSAAPLIAAVLGRIFLGETIRPITYVTIAAVICGFALMVCDSLHGWSLTGDFFALLIAIGYAVSIVLTRRYHHIGMIPAACWGTIISTFVSLPLASPTAITTHDFAILSLFGAGQLGLGLALFVTGAAMLPAAHTALLGMLEAILGTLWAWIFFGEAPGTTALVGGVIVMVSILTDTLSGAAIDRRRAVIQHETVPPVS
jgi:drug/metabolite transporter (DMT)-like permease